MSLVASIGAVLTGDNLPSSIELLPGDPEVWLTTGQDYLMTEGNLGIPQKTAHKAYLQAVEVFRSCPSSKHLGTEVYDSTDVVNNLISSSAVLLLVNPAHQTALNARKRLVIAGLVDASLELRLNAAFLTLRECSKQSIMWHHRRWLLRRIGSTSKMNHSEQDEDLIMDEDILYDAGLPVSVLSEELVVTSRAAETYQRNYFAWSHRRRVFDALVFLTRQALEARSADLAKLVTLLVDEHASIMKWVDLHVSDYTAMQYLHAIDELILPLVTQSSALLPRSSNDDFEDRLPQHIQSLLQAYPEHESVWMYTRLAPPRDDSGLPPLGGHTTEQARANARRFLAWYAFRLGSATPSITPRDVSTTTTNTRHVMSVLLKSLSE
ncbi:hypothetical protein EIP91_009769 [Steccherinum ochraceum]|uniref:Protein prenyltransferase alpha subunit repeat-containing protein 1 n=1 Tax=Steccherinum ochraceum TaxID=92696 RepID=A0A4R0R3X0_9APHY|nr:hypothetical protein EIP91_009769 [Steccherinum ochraceum]